MNHVPLKSLCVIKHGGTPSKANPVFWRGEIPWVSPKDMKTTVIFGAADQISREAVENSATSVVPEKSILVVVRSGVLVHSLPVAQVARPVAFNQDIKALIPDHAAVDPDYLYWFVRAQENLVLTRGVKKGATVHSVQSGFLENLLVPMPARSEQRRIVDLLSRAEGIVRLRREAEKKAAELIPAIFLDMFGDPATNPKEWPVTRLDDLCDLVRGSSPRPQGDSRFFGGPVPRLMIADITRDGVYVKPAIDSLTVEGAKKSRPMHKGEVVMAVSGAVGLPAILAIDACIHDGFVGFRSLDDAVSPEFFYNFLAAFRRHSIGQAVGATFQNLKTDQIRDWMVPIPPPDLQSRFQKTANDLRGLETQQSAATDKAQATFDALLTQAFSPKPCATFA